MRYPATEKLGFIRLVEQSHLSVRQTLDKLGIPRPTFYRWYDRFQTHGVEGLEDRTSAPSRVWNRILTISGAGSSRWLSTIPICRRASWP
jgi:hypothetical protein